MANGILGGLPPGLRGYVAAEQQSQQRDMNQLAQMQGIFGLQEAMESKPLQRALLQLQVDQARENLALRRSIGAGGTPAGPQAALAQGAALGDIGPTVTNAARISQVPQGGVGGYGIDTRVQAMLLSGDPGMTALAKAQLEQRKPVVGREGAPILERNPDGSYRVAFSAAKTEPGVQVTYGPGGTMQAGEIPNYGNVVSGLAGRTTAAQEQARAERDLITVPGVGDQPPIYRSRAQLLPSAQGPAVPRAPTVAPPGPAIPRAPTAAPVAGPSPAQVAAQGATAAYGNRVATQGAEADVAQHETAINAQESIAKMNQLLTHLKTSEAITGMGAEVFKGIERFKVLAANSERSGRRVSDTELLDAMMGSDVFPMIKQLGIGARGLDTPAEREFLRQVMSGTIPMIKQTLIRMTEMRKDIAERAIARWDRRVEGGELDRYFTATGRTKERLGQGRRATDTDNLLRQADDIIRRGR